MIKVNNLSIGYEGKSIVENISFNVEAGDYLCIVGENGTGKSTLVKTILRLQKPLSGSIEFAEKGIGYLPQQTVVQKDFPASVWEIVLSGTLSKIGMRPFYSAKEKAQAKENMERLGVWELRKECFRNLSGGQKQRVLLARALCASQKILFLDEPVTGLDPKVTTEFYQLIRDMNKEGVTIIMVTHDVQMIREYSSHILHIGGEQVYYGKTKDYLQSDFAASLGLDMGKEEM